MDFERTVLFSMSSFSDPGSITQGRLNTELMSNSAGTDTNRDENSARKRAKYAEMTFRISKGYEKDSLWTRIKYFFKER